MPKTQKHTWERCSRFIRLRDALEYCAKMGIDIKQFARPEDLPAKCCTCEVVKPWIRMTAGHFISRGSGGLSGVYFDERNSHAQCKQCNAFYQGRALEYQDFMLAKYGQAVIDELRWLDKNNSYKYKLTGLELYYKQKYQEMVRSLNEAG